MMYGIPEKQDFDFSVISFDVHKMTVLYYYRYVLMQLYRYYDFFSVVKDFNF